MALAQGLDLVGIAMPQGWELLIILALVFLLFGAKKMPDAARGIGKSLRILKTETKGLRDEGEDEAAEVESSTAEAITSGSAASTDAMVDVSGAEATADLRAEKAVPKEASASE